MRSVSMLIPTYSDVCRQGVDVRRQALIDGIRARAQQPPRNHESRGKPKVRDYISKDWVSTLAAVRREASDDIQKKMPWKRYYTRFARKQVFYFTLLFLESHNKIKITWGPKDNGLHGIMRYEILDESWRKYYKLISRDDYGVNINNTSSWFSEASTNLGFKKENPTPDCKVFIFYNK